MKQKKAECEYYFIIFPYNRLIINYAAIQANASFQAEYIRMLYVVDLKEIHYSLWHLK